MDPDKKAECLRMMEGGATHRVIAKTMGVSIGALSKWRKEAGIGTGELNIDIPSGHKVTAAMVNKDGEFSVRWIKPDVIEDEKLMLDSFVDSLTTRVDGGSAEIAPPEICNADLMVGYPTPEPHYGMLSWGKETGEDYDCKLAANIVRGCMGRLIESAPAAEYALISDIGDWFHTDSVNNETSKSKNKLDVDNRWPKILELGEQVFIDLINMVLKKHKKVFVKGVGGNHSPHTSLALARIMNAWFRNNDRVDVDLSPNPFKYHVFGKNLIGINHGDMGKQADMPMVMAQDCPDWSRTEFRVFWTGHIHHLTRKEYPGCVVETFRSVAAKDSWHHQSGYRAGRDAQCIVFHREFGEIQRNRVGIEQIV